MDIKTALFKYSEEKRAKLNGIVLDELGVTIYFRAMSVAEKIKVFADADNRFEVAARTLCYRARDEHDALIFQPAELVDIRKRMNGELVDKIANAMFADEISQAEAEKK